ncbi:MAG: DUF2490 domain-containing protein [Cyanobacteria bacterium J06628_3]
MIRLFSLVLLLFTSQISFSQSVDEDQLGAWYMYFFNKRFNNSEFGLQGDYQFRYWNFGSDLEQILLRTGITYSPKDINIMFTLGYGNITSGTPGESSSTSGESRIYQEALFPQKIGKRFLLNHRLRFEQRWVDGQDMRTRYRYNLFVNVPLNNTALEQRTVYLAFYNEIFVNGQRSIGDGRLVEYFDRNRTYMGVGYGLLKNLRVQVGWMRQTTANWAKGQLQFSLHHAF